MNLRIIDDIECTIASVRHVQACEAERPTDTCREEEHIPDFVPMKVYHIYMNDD